MSVASAASDPAPQAKKEGGLPPSPERPCTGRRRCLPGGTGFGGSGPALPRHPDDLPYRCSLPGL